MQKLSQRNDLELVLNTVDKWIKKKDVAGAVLHSDQGFQYTSKLYNNRLEAYGINGSHSRNGNQGQDQVWRSICSPADVSFTASIASGMTSC
ncbi:DDE-type integrase/transposase/recombinase [Metabacillus idriensis]|uniref:DDE-type integrase/transposase/recombinase n=1 Tax=Metabacillus idriensis TaxID=324768 RepID=UPI00398FDAC0